MSAYDDTKRMLRMRDKMLCDAYHGRGGLSMSDAERERYKAERASVRDARRRMRDMLAAMSEAVR